MKRCGEGWRMRDEGCGVKLMSCEGVSCELWVMNYELCVMSYECGVKSWSWNILLYEEILHYAVLRSEWQGSVFCSRLGICFSGGIFFETQRFFFLNCFFKWAKLAKFIRFEALWELLFKLAYFLSQSSRRCGEMIAFLRALRNIGDVLGRSRIFGWQL